MVKTFLINILLVLTASAFASESCSNGSRTLTSPERKMYARSIASNLSKFRSPADITVQKALAVANWTVVWATPTGAEQGMFFFSQEKTGLVYHDVWGGYATPSERANVMRWVMQLSPSVPREIARCFADAVTAGH